ncbi:MAG: hypothetical protein LBW77_05745 [Verrucomicrobiota bacterium]|jgi:hypothetical protein|nr:hypothetical protein [Verrucomicrobiota bacterium]
MKNTAIVYGLILLSAVLCAGASVADPAPAPQTNSVAVAAEKPADAQKTVSRAPGGTSRPRLAWMRRRFR